MRELSARAGVPTAVHIGMHGGARGLHEEGSASVVSWQQLARALEESASHVHVVVLAACGARSHARMVAAAGIPVVYPQASVISNAAAVRHARRFYAYLTHSSEKAVVDALDIANRLDEEEEEVADSGCSEARGDRALRPFALVRSGEAAYEPRPYQDEVVEACFHNGRYVNTIIVTPTNSGKTHMAARVVRRIRAQGNGAVVVVCEREVLAQQLASSLADALGATASGDAIEVEAFSAGRNALRFVDVVRSKGVAVITAGMLKDMLRLGTVALTSVALLVFDECHECAGESPASVILNDYWRPLHVTRGAAPAILGMTATPWKGATAGSPAAALSRLCDNMHCHNIATVVREKASLEAVVGHRVETEALAERRSGGADGVCEHLRALFANLCGQLRVGDAITERWSDEAALCTFAHSVDKIGRERRSSRVSACGRLIRAVADAVYALKCVGGDAALASIARAIDEEELIEDEGTRGVLREAAPVVHRLRAAICPEPTAAEVLERLSPVARRAFRVLQERTHNGEGGQAILMCTRRTECEAVWSALAVAMPTLHPVRLLGEMQPEEAAQSYRNFRRGVARVLVTTPIAHCGLDFPGCGTLVALCLRLSAVDTIQARGRVRHRGGKFVAIDYEDTRIAQSVERATRVHAEGDIALARHVSRQTDATVASHAVQDRLHAQREEQREKERRARETTRAAHAAVYRLADYRITCRRCHEAIAPATALVLYDGCQLCVREGHALVSLQQQTGGTEPLACPRCRSHVAHMFRLRREAVALPSLKRETVYLSGDGREDVLGTDIVNTFEHELERRGMQGVARH